MDEQTLRQMITEEAAKGNKLKALLYDNTVRVIFEKGREFDPDTMIKNNCIRMEVSDMYKTPAICYKPIETIQGIFFAAEDIFDDIDALYLFRS